MRVWALASCSGLLALAACSAEQSSSPNPNAAPLDGEDAAIQTQPGLTATASSPMARPEVRPRPVIQRGYRLSSSAGKPAAADSSRQALPQAAELRQRLERLRNQQGARLSPSTPLVTAPQPATLARPTLSGASSVNRPVEQNISAFSPIRPPSVSPQGVAALPTPPRPTPSAPQANAPTPGAAPDLGRVAEASVARAYPLAPLGHQGYSARSQRPTPVLTGIQTAESSTTARLHGGTPTAQQPESLVGGETSAAQVAIVEGSTSPQPSSLGANAATNVPTPTLAVRSAASTPAPEVAGGHQSSGPAALTPIVQPTVGLESAAEDHRSQAVSAAVASEPVNPAPVLRASARAETAVALPESLPLNPRSPQLTLVRPQPTAAAVPEDSTARANLAEASAIPERILVPSRFPNAARIAAPDPQPPLSNSESLQESLQSTATLGEASAAPELHHQGQVSAETIRLIPTASHPLQGLPIAYCLSPSGELVPATLAAQGSSASLPQFSPANQADPSLDLAATLSKENPVAPCQGVPAATADLTATPPSPDEQSQP